MVIAVPRREGLSRDRARHGTRDVTTKEKRRYAYPYGVYDLARNKGFVNVGTDHDTGAFAVASIRGWWRSEGQRLYPREDCLTPRGSGPPARMRSPRPLSAAVGRKEIDARASDGVRGETMTAQSSDERPVPEVAAAVVGAAATTG